MLCVVQLPCFPGSPLSVVFGWWSWFLSSFYCFHSSLRGFLLRLQSFLLSRRIFLGRRVFIRRRFLLHFELFLLLCGLFLLLSWRFLLLSRLLFLLGRLPFFLRLYLLLSLVRWVLLRLYNLHRSHDTLHLLYSHSHIGRVIRMARVRVP